MMPQEARWFRERIHEIAPESLFPMLNVGSQTDEFRRRDQPWIQRELFGPLEHEGRQVLHSDIQAAAGVDLVGDLADPGFLARVKALGVKSIFCSNVLEHVENPRQLSAAMTQLLPIGAYLFISVPRSMPYHPDPIDTRFRPDPDELAELFPGTIAFRTATLKCGTMAQYVMARALADPAKTAQSIAWRGRRKPAASSAVGQNGESVLRWLFKTLEMTCLVLRKASG